MSEFLAEATVLIRPDTTAFRADLLRKLQQLKIPPVQIPIVATGAGVGSAALATSALADAQRVALGTTTQLDTATRIANTSWAKQAVLLNVVSKETLEKAGADDAAAGAASRHAVSQNQLRRGFLATGLAAIGARGATLAASSSFLIGAVAATAIVKSLQAFAQFEVQLRVFAATTGATAAELERVSAVSRQLGQDVSLPGVSATNAAQAMTELAKAGLDVEDALAGARGVLQLATAAQISQAEAAEFAANALNAFGLAGDQATRVADVLANASNSAQGSIQDFGIAFQQVSAVARQVGFSLEETAVTLTLLAQNGLRGSDAGTSLRVALLRLVNPTKKAADVIEQLGIQIRDAQGNIRPDVFVQFGEATRSFTPAMRDAAFATVFGADAIRAVAIASREGRAGLLEVTDAINQEGTAALLAGARTQGLAGQAEALKNNLSTTAVEAGKLAAIFAGPLVVAVNALVLAFNNILSPFSKLVDLVGAFKGPDFDPATASAAEFLERVRDLQEEIEGAGNLGEQLFGAKFTAATEGAIGALERQRAQFKALGLDITPINLLIKQLQADLDNLGEADAGEDVAESLSPLQQAAKTTRELIKQAAADGIDTGPLKRTLREIDTELAQAAEKARFRGAALARNFNAGAADLGKPVVNILRGLQEEALDIQIGGGGADAEVANLRAQEAQLRRRIAALSGAPEKREEAKEELLRVLDEIESIQESEKREAESRSQKIAAEALDSDRAVAEALIGGRSRLENLISRAAGTEGLRDDIRFTTALRALIQRQIDEARKRIKNTEIQKEFIAAANRLLVTLLLDIKRDRQQAARDAAAAIRERQQNVIEGLQLDVEFASITGNVQAEIRARQKLIAALEKLKKQARGQKNKVKELRNEIAQERAAIEELRGEKQKENKAFAETAFEFFQKREGFAANLLGNLIPMDATQGLVGNQPPPPTAPLNALAAVKASRDQGVTPGQFGQLIGIQSKMLDVLERIAGRGAHPEAQYQRVSSSGGSAMDVM